MFDYNKNINNFVKQVPLEINVFLELYEC